MSIFNLESIASNFFSSLGLNNSSSNNSSEYSGVNLIPLNLQEIVYPEEEKEETPNDVQEQNTIEEDDIKFVEPVNETDPWVLHDPTVGQSVVVQKYQPQDTNNEPDLETEDPAGANEEYDLTRTNGILYPLVKINSHNIDHENIIYMKISYTGFVPTLNITIRDNNNVLKKIDSPGLNNTITVVMIPETDGIYNSVSINFYITSCDTSNPERISYSGTYLFAPLTETKYTKQIKYPGCSNSKDGVNCNDSEQIYPNTWEYLHEIAKYTGLGFASTQNCQDIQDRLPRLVRNMTYQEFIEKQILMSGLDENSMFDVWVDLYRFIVMVNVSWVMKKDITYKQLSIKAVTGKNTTDKKAFKSRTKEVYRTLSNFNKTEEPSNLEFDENQFVQHIDNEIKYDGGIHTDSPVFQIRGGAVDNTGNIGVMNTQSVMAVESSVDGTHINDYRNDSMNRNTIQVDAYNTNYQKLIREKYFQLKRSKYFELELARNNFGLQRGTLVNITYFTRDPAIKQKILEGSSAVLGIDPENIEPDNFKFEGPDGETEKDLIMNEDTQIPDPSKSGLYYIDGMTFEYSYSWGHIKQKLLLIKKGLISNLQNNHTSPKFNSEALGVVEEDNITEEDEFTMEELASLNIKIPLSEYKSIPSVTN